MSTNDRSTNIILAVLTILATVAIAAIPWAYGVQGRLVRIETLLHGSEELPKELHSLDHRVSAAEYRISALEALNEGS